MIERSMRSINSCGSSSGGPSSSSTNQQVSSKQRTCMASTVAPPVSFKKIMSGITLMKENSFTASNTTSANTSSPSRGYSSQQQQQQHRNHHQYEGIFAEYYPTSTAAVVDNMSLHDLCRKGHPKLEEIVWVIKHNPSCLESKNDSGQYPLHVAVANAILPEAIVVMVWNFPKACATPDIYGKLPLHYATASSGWTIKNGKHIFDASENASNGVVHPEYMNMVKLICKAYTGALVHEDNDGCNPIEYALLDDAPEDLIRNLQRTSVNYQRARTAMMNAQSPSPSRRVQPEGHVTVQCV